MTDGIPATLVGIGQQFARPVIAYPDSTVRPGHIVYHLADRKTGKILLFSATDREVIVGAESDWEASDE